MERNSQKNGLINLVALLLVGAAGFAVARFAQSLAGQVGMVFIGLGFLVAAVSWFQSRLEERERIEKLEFDELVKARSGSSLFESKDSEGFPAQRAREQFERFFVPAFTVLLFLLQAVGAYLLWRWVSKSPAGAELKQPTVALALFGLFALILFLLGRFSATVARLENRRLLRPSASWMLLGAYLFFIVAVGIIAVEAEFPRADFYVAYGLCILLGLIAVETLISLLLEIYRPRLKGKVERPLYESRLVGLLGQPEGLFTTAAQALDYQFGFKVSETSFFRLGEKYLPVTLLMLLAALFVSTSVVFIEPGEQGLLERFGRPVEGRTLLDPGAHFKWPWPVDKVHRYHTEQIQTFNVGYIPDPKFASQNTQLWTVAHAKEDVNFLVANRDQGVSTADAVSGRSAPPVSLLTVSIPVHFQVHDLRAWVYHNDGASNLLFSIATREAVRYFVSADLEEVMSRSRREAAQTLRQRIQAAADERELGVLINFVGVQDIHPPAKVAPDYEKVVAAGHSKQAAILAARAEGIKTNALASATATNLLDVAIGDRATREISAVARAALFTNQIPAYRAAPSVYVERAYLDAFILATAGARKYIVLATNTQDVIQFDLQDKIREDLLGLGLAPRK